MLKKRFFIYPNKLKLTRGALCLFALLCARLVSHGQTADTAYIKKLLSAIDSYNSKLTPEKLYLNFDKPYYAAGDTIWFKVNLLNAATNKASAYSNKVYVELLNDSSKVLQTLVIPMSSGLGAGDIKLDGNFWEGACTIRAYTNWMQNFGEAQFFHQRFFIGKPGSGSWLATEQHTATVNAQGTQVNIGLALKNLQGLPVVNQAFTMRVQEGRKGILKNDIQTGVDGMVNTSFTLPAKTDTRKFSLLVEDKADKTKKITFPFYTRADNDIDLQFMPEGGNLIAGLYNRVAFKAIGEDGLGADVAGRIINSKNEEVAIFKSAHAGMGTLALVPAPGETYTAKIKLANGQEKAYNLPAAKLGGTVLRADVVSNPDTIRLYITGTADKAGTSYSLLAQGRGTTYFGTPFTLINGAFNARIPKNKFPTGIVNFTVLDADGKTVNARNVFVDRHDGLSIAMVTNKPVYAAMDSIALNFKVSDQQNNPIQANFSVTVTDDGQVKDALRDQHILSYFLLSSELKGHIEHPDWYFDGANRSGLRALDNLMLTQAWVGFTAEKVINKPAPEPVFWAEANNSLEGQLRNILNRPAPNRRVTLMSNKHGLFVVDTVSNAEGKFKFSNLPLEDTTLYTIKIHKSNGAEAAVGIDVKEFKPAAPPPPDSTRLMPWYANTDTTLLNYLKGTQKRVAQSLGPVDAKGHLLREVNIKDRKKAKLQGAEGEDVYFADEDLTEKDMVKDGNISLLKYMYKNVKGFHAGTPRKSIRQVLFEKAAMIRNIYIDSVSIFRYINPGDDVLRFEESMLDNIPAAAVKNLMIYHKPSPNGTDWWSYLLIKTRTGNGPILKETPGVYIYRPLPLYMPRDFYRPRYAVKTAQPDLRSTIHWEPNLVSDVNGNAALSFYAADKPGTYTVTIEGTDMQGHFGVATRKITIGHGAAAFK